jgi:DNA-binding CsgD family transcriptional regulator/ABC-type branched-subunit amino acid transport system substrate-binding protein
MVRFADDMAPLATSQRWLQPEVGRGRGSDPAFFAARPDLVQVARRAVGGLRGSTVSYLDIRGDDVRRVTVDVSDSERRIACLDVTDEEPPFGLTPRELQVATCVAGGLSNPQIAAALACSRRTVATHVEHILTKLGAPARTSIATLLAASQAYAAPLPSDDLVLPGDLMTVLHGALPARTPTAARAVRRRPILLGAVYPAAPFGGADVTAMRRGGQLAVRELNSRGGVGGRRVEQVVVDATPDGLREAVAGLTARGVDAMVLGNFPLPDARRAIPEAAASGAPVLHSMIGQALSDDVHADPVGLGPVFQVCSTESAYVPGLLRTARQLEHGGAFRPRHRRLALVLRESTFYDGAVEQVQRQVDEAGWDLVLLHTVPDRTEDFGDLTRRLAELDPDALSLPVLPEATLRAFLLAARGLRERTLIHAAWSPAAPEFTRRFGGLSEGLLWSTLIGNVGSPACAGFEQRYRAAFGSDPGLGAAAVHYDMVNVLAQAWGRVSRPWDFAGVREQLRSASWFGVTGAQHFVGRGQRGLSYPDDTLDPTLAHPHLVYRISGGHSRRLAPAPAIAG